MFIISNYTDECGESKGGIYKGCSRHSTPLFIEYSGARSYEPEEKSYLTDIIF
jgi:hypothetical protein